MKSKKNVPKRWNKPILPRKWKVSRQRKQNKYKKKVCRFTADPELAKQINYKNIELLERFITNRGKIIPRRITGTSARYQRVLAREIRKARSIGLLPYKVN